MEVTSRETSKLDIVLVIDSWSVEAWDEAPNYLRWLPQVQDVLAEILVVKRFRSAMSCGRRGKND